jgi:HSP20 family molecular chaperone IbpA
METTMQVKDKENTKIEKSSNVRLITPFVNQYQSGDATILVIDMPGVNESNIDISFDKDILTIKGESKPETFSKVTPLHTEFELGTYIRKFTISKPIDIDKAKAVLKNGRLTLTLPWIAPNYKKIEVKSE